MITAEEARQATIEAKTAKKEKAKQDLAESNEAIQAFIDGTTIEECIMKAIEAGQPSIQLPMATIQNIEGVTIVDGSFVTAKLKEKLETKELGYKVLHNASWTIYWGD